MTPLIQSLKGQKLVIIHDCFDARNSETVKHIRVKTSLGDNFDKVAAAFSDESGMVAKALAEQVAADAKADFTAEVQAYADGLQYKHDGGEVA